MSRPVFKKVSNTNFRENATRESQADTFGRTDEYDEDKNYLPDTNLMHKISLFA
jgi:hypothetical protein